MVWRLSTCQRALVPQLNAVLADLAANPHTHTLRTVSWRIIYFTLSFANGCKMWKHSMPFPTITRWFLSFSLVLQHNFTTKTFSPTLERIRTLERRTIDNGLEQTRRAGGRRSCEVCVRWRGCALHSAPRRRTTKHLNHSSELLLPLQIPIRAISDISCLQLQFHVEECWSRSYRIVHKSQQLMANSNIRGRDRDLD